MPELHLPVQQSGNASWVWHDTTELSVKAFVGDVPTIGWFPAVPSNEMWAFERIAVTCPFAEGVSVLAVVDPLGGTDDLAASNNDYSTVVDGLILSGAPVEVIARAYPLRVLGGSALGIHFFDGSDRVAGYANAQITKYRRG